MLIFFILYFIPSYSLAQIQVQVTDPYFEGDKLKKPHAVQVHKAEAVENNQLPKSTERDQFFAQFISIQKYYQTLDGLDRDLLWHNLQTKKLSELQKKYPQVPMNDLKMLQTKLKEIKHVKK
jgi:hypothetical protein